MKDLSVMAVLKSQANLSEPVQDLIFGQVVLRHFWLALVLSLVLLNF